METACSLAQWPVALRGDNLAESRASAFSPEEVRRYVRRSIASGAKILERGELLAIFPEGYPTIDPSGSRKASDDEFLPFAPGLFAIVERAERARGARIPILPVGFAYAPASDGRYDVSMRIGLPIERGRNRRAGLAELEARVRTLSQ
jgi:1-acyl-sn-glycerol-3-phosphate acyltransferase